nr:Gag-Pol polyprotein [Tanacetum cinerariifolium]
MINASANRVLRIKSSKRCGTFRGRFDLFLESFDFCIRAEKIARVANPLALVAQQQPVYHPQNHPTHYTQNSSTRSQQAATRNRGKAIVNSPEPIYDQEPSMVAEDDETSKDKDIDKLMALISLSLKKIYKPTNNNLRTSSNTSRANQDNSLRINKSVGYENQRIGNVAGARENVARECQKPKRAKDAAYHREKMLLCKQEEAGIQLNAEQVDWRDDTNDDELEDQELEAHYMYMAQLQEVSPDAADSWVFETYKNVKQEIRDQLNAEAEAVQIILTRIDNDIYSTVDACPNACEMWKAIKRLKQGESINVQDLETNLFWEFRKFTSLDGESLESYYSRFYKMMNELARNQCKSQELKNVSYHKLYVILKQHQHEVNEIRAEKIARVANPLALVTTQQPVYHPQTHPTHYNQNSSTITQQAATRNRGKAIVNSPQPIYDQEPSMVDDDDETSKDKEIDKLMALISLSFKKIYKPTNNNLRTSSNTSRANQDNFPRIHRNAGYESQRSGNVAWARETVGSSMVQKSGIQC